MQDPSQTPRSGSLFDTSFPSAPIDRPAAPTPAAGERSKGMRLVLPIALFVVAISGLAWIAQYLPNWRAKPQTGSPPPPAAAGSGKTELLKFDEMHSLWDADDPRYPREYEKGQKGSYDFAFANTSEHPVELGLNRTSCDCSRVDVAVFPASDAAWKKYQAEKKPSRVKLFPAGEGLPWKALAMDERKGIEVPQGHRGIVRISWEGKKSEGEQLRLTTYLWAQPKEQMRAREYPILETQVILMPAIRFIQDDGGKLVPGERASVGTLAARDVGRATFYCWSGTRSNLKLTLLKNKVSEKGPYEFTIEPLSESETLALEKKLIDGTINTRVQSAYRVKVKVHEPRMDQGPFNTHLPLAYDGTPLEGGPVVTGHVRGEVQVAASESGKVDLASFNVKDGVRQVVPLTAEGNVELTYDSHYPTFLEVKLAKDTQGSMAGQTRWNLEVRIPAGYGRAGSLPPNSAVILRMSGPNSRLIRIPVVGNAVQG